MHGDLFVQQFAELDERSKKLFTDVLQDLFIHCYITRGGLIRANPHFTFLDRHEELVADYLALSGWKLQIDREHGIARFYHSDGSGRVHFNRDETILLLVLRQLYHEHQQAASEISDVLLRLGTVRERLQQILPATALKPFMSSKHTGRMLRGLERIRIIAFQGSSHLVNEDTLFAVLPSIQHLVSQQSLEQTQNRLNELLQETDTAES